jgi:hypothetical protein
VWRADADLILRKVYAYFCLKTLALYEAKDFRVDDVSMCSHHPMRKAGVNSSSLRTCAKAMLLN